MLTLALEDITVIEAGGEDLDEDLVCVHGGTMEK
jgi:hypothetical protein